MDSKKRNKGNNTDKANGNTTMSQPRVATESSAMAADIDGSSVQSRATNFSYASTRPGSGRHHGDSSRGYSLPRGNSNQPRRSSDSSHQHHHGKHHGQQQHHDGNSTVCSGGGISIASAGSGGSHRSNNSRSRRRRSRSRSHDAYHGKDNYYEKDDYYRDRDRHPPMYQGGGGKYDDDRSGKSSSRYEDDRSAGSSSRKYQGEDASYGSYKSNSGSRRRSRSEGSHRDGDFRRRSSSYRSMDRGSRSPPNSPVTDEWPPCFETDGSAFVFDNRSAMFYEALSDFFYDPKSKLYYGNRKGAYFRYDMTLSPPAFVEVQKVAQPAAASEQDGGGAQSAMDQVPIQTTTMPQGGADVAKPKIAIKLKTKKIQASSQSSAPSSPIVDAAAAVSKDRKAQIANIQKWTEKQAELKQDSHTSFPVTSLPPGSPSAATTSAKQPAVVRPVPVVAETGKIRMTSKGEPICLVCKRKFPNIDKLRLHERASELHKKNLKQLQKQEQVAGAVKRKSSETTTAAAEYQDRAQKRRQLHGPDNMMHDRRAANMLLHNHSEPAAPGAPLDESHVGHQMLQKMGWKGHNNDASDNNQTGQGDRKSSSSNNTTDQLRKDWDRIEALAKNGRPR